MPAPIGFPGTGAGASAHPLGAAECPASENRVTPTGRLWYVLPVAETDYREIIALFEDPDVSFDGDAGRPVTSQEDMWLAESADASLLGRSIEKQGTGMRDMPIEVAPLDSDPGVG